ncbi:MAG: carbohydrate ABC transporter permease [candidate division KSB1 bacterium]|nr:carbohydrate ABC transporter permease [candidate division KSB1 bacterium]MDZ7294104.1 carbohydrate ABC transporter permease [candidate division KSB1 bacterium]MDZ7377852.1 carbohydrate ABC transporter permease [candidate division KSB1 bacterium]MDZ7412998.1 carbohydrate ABC transporter permease [candidate division KSB1 bacterium]
MRGRRGKVFWATVRSIVLHAALFLVFALTLAPFAWMLSTSLKATGASFTLPPQWIPRPATLAQYRTLLAQMNFARATLNSVVVAVSVTLLGLFINSLAGYGFAKFEFPGRQKLFGLLLASMMIPGQVAMLPLFMMFNKLGLLNNYLGLIIPGMASMFGIFLLKQFMMSIPDALLDSARIDGASEWRIYWQVVLPLTKPALATLGVFSFMGAWNDFLWPLIVMTKQSMYTLPVALANLTGEEHRTQYELLMAGSVVVILPIAIAFLAMQRFYMSGITAGSLKE